MTAAAPDLTDVARCRTLLEERFDAACARIAPAWPLDRSIAVNPFWGLRHLEFGQAAGRLATLGNVHMFMPADHYASRWRNGLGPEHLARAAAELGEAPDVDALVAHLNSTTQPGHWHNISDLLDRARDLSHSMGWREEIVHQISQFCASALQRGGVLDAPPASGEDGVAALYARWLDVTRQDRGIALLMGEPALPEAFRDLPVTPRALMEAAMTELKLPDELASDYGHALLLDINGWASCLAYRRWQADLNGRSDGMLLGLLAIRLAWDLVLWRHQARTDTEGFAGTRAIWSAQIGGLSAMIAANTANQRRTLVWQRAAELAYQDRLHAVLRQRPHDRPSEAPILQAVFCIDVRSEAVRRGLEAQHPDIRTLGFAGFFGLPLEFQPEGSALCQPQLPGLLKPALRVHEERASGPGLSGQGRRRARQAARARLADATPGAFSLVESSGLLCAVDLIRNAIGRSPAAHPFREFEHARDWTITKDGVPLSLEARVELAAGVLSSMDLVEKFAPTVLLVGHASSSSNNPQASALDCGACGGQSGELNVRVLSWLLQDEAVRSGLRARGIAVPEATRFVAVLHDTTTDELRCLDSALQDEPLAAWLAEASRCARGERGMRLGQETGDDRALLAATHRRAGDWSELRPEWGLAGNAAFVAAPRTRTAHLDLEGRAFLHDYRWEHDTDGSRLELILTAPMVVANWINAHYYASVTDNLKFGSGNKVLHNVVGGNLGVFEGNGGDLRIGLSLQSLHDGDRWMHEALRLSVYVAAPRDAIAGIVARHQVVRDLVDNDWLFLFRLDDDGKTIERCYRGAWWGCDAGVSVPSASA